VIPRLAERHRVLAPDLRGWGWSDAPRGDYAKATFAADTLALMDAEGLGRVSLVGHDWGGYVAFLLALRHPERIERMVGLDIAPPWLAGSGRATSPRPWWAATRRSWRRRSWARDDDVGQPVRTARHPCGQWSRDAMGR